MYTTQRLSVQDTESDSPLGLSTAQRLRVGNVESDSPYQVFPQPK